MPNLSSQAESVLQRFGTAHGESLRQAGRDLLALNALIAVAKDARLAVGLDRLAGEAQRAGGSELANTLALLWRLTAQTPLRDHRRRIVGHLVGRMSTARPPFSVLTDPADRRYLAEALGDTGGEPIIPHLIEALVTEESGEKAREELAHSLLRLVPELSTAITMISQVFAELPFGQQDASTSRSKRFIRIITSLEKATREIDPEVTAAFGPAYADLVGRAVKGGEIDRVTRYEAIAASLSYLALVVRLHGALAADPSMFQPVAALRGSFSSTSWPKDAEPHVENLSRRLEEALLMLARQGVADNDLRSAYILLQGEIAARLRLTKLTQSSADITATLRDWLIEGRALVRRELSEAADESLLNSIERDLAMLLRDAVETSPALEDLRERLVDALAADDRVLAADVTRVMGRVARIMRQAVLVARKRSLEVRGRPGEVVEFNPIEHEGGVQTVGMRRVRMRSRIVERVVEGRSDEVILKAEVEPT